MRVMSARDAGQNQCLAGAGRSAKVKQIVYANFDCVMGRTRADINRSTSAGDTYVQKFRIEVQIIVFDLDRPTARQCVFDAGTDKETSHVVASRCVSGKQKTAVQRGVIIKRTPGPAALAVNQRAIKGDTGTAGDAEVTGVLCAQAHAVNGRDGHGIGRLSVRPGAFTLDTDHPIALLIVATHLAAGNRPCTVVARAARAFEIRGRRYVGRRGANVGPDVTSGPVEHGRCCNGCLDRCSGVSNS
jgi:hypothetical protein